MTVPIEVIIPLARLALARKLFDPHDVKALKRGDITRKANDCPIRRQLAKSIIRK